MVLPALHISGSDKTGQRWGVRCLTGCYVKGCSTQN